MQIGPSVILHSQPPHETRTLDLPLSIPLYHSTMMQNKLTPMAIQLIRNVFTYETTFLETVHTTIGRSPKYCRVCSVEQIGQRYVSSNTRMALQRPFQALTGLLRHGSKKRRDCTADETHDVHEECHGGIKCPGQERMTDRQEETRGVSYLIAC